MAIPKKLLTAVIGATAAGIVATNTPVFEGPGSVGYLDPVGVPTACHGHTGKDVVVGKRYTPEYCAELFDKDAAIHAKGVLKCTPGIKDKPYALAASVDFAYHMGVGAYCGSSIARSFNAGDIKAGCVRFNRSAAGDKQWMWATVKGQKVILPGLERRADWRRAMCETSL